MIKQWSIDFSSQSSLVYTVFTTEFSLLSVMFYRSLAEDIVRTTLLTPDFISILDSQCAQTRTVAGHTQGPVPATLCFLWKYYRQLLLLQNSKNIFLIENLV